MFGFAAFTAELSNQQIENGFNNAKIHYEDLFIEHYFKVERKDLTKEQDHEMDCFGMFGMTEWVQDNVLQKGK